MHINRRSLLAVTLFVPLAAILLATFACLPAPVGDPEKSKVDESLAGIYRAQPADPADKSTILAILRPWDAKTYVLQYMEIGTQDGKEKRQIDLFKAWLTTIADKTFLTAQPMDGIGAALGKPDDKNFWAVFRLDKVDAGMEVRMINPDSEFVKGLKKQEEIEAAIKTHASDKGLYGEALTFKKLTASDQAIIDEVLSKFDTSHSAK